MRRDERHMTRRMLNLRIDVEIEKDRRRYGWTACGMICI